MAVGETKNAYAGLIKSQRWLYAAHLGRPVLRRFMRGFSGYKKQLKFRDLQNFGLLIDIGY